jgi:hypothetical protein
MASARFLRNAEVDTLDPMVTPVVLGRGNGGPQHGRRQELGVGIINR